MDQGRGSRAKLEIVARSNDRKTIIDEYGALDARIDWTAVNRHAKLEASIRGWFKDSEPGTPVSANGNRYKVILSPRGTQQRITSMSKVFALLGRKTFLEHCSFTLENLKKLLSGSQVDELTISEQTGGRKIEVVALEQERAA
jgi:hypothetical protein